MSELVRLESPAFQVIFAPVWVLDQQAHVVLQRSPRQVGVGEAKSQWNSTLDIEMESSPLVCITKLAVGSLPAIDELQAQARFGRARDRCRQTDFTEAQMEIRPCGSVSPMDPHR